jgi:hypothetical protein
MEEGISPVNSFSPNDLEIKLDNFHKAYYGFQLTMFVNLQDFQRKRVFFLSTDFQSNILK